MMGFSKVALALMCATALAMVPCGQAQNSPQDYLAAHNAARAAVGVGPMTWDPTVADYAENYARSRSGDCQLVHSGGAYGENIFWGGSGKEWSATEAVGLWVDEKQWYDYNSNSCSAPDGNSCGHYTQVVWSSSTQLGCARVKCNNGDIFITCNYNPPGNWVGERPY